MVRTERALNELAKLENVHPSRSNRLECEESAKVQIERVGCRFEVIELKL